MKNKASVDLECEVKSVDECQAGMSLHVYTTPMIDM